MSHFTRIKTQIKSKDTLLACLEKMDLDIEENTRIRAYAGAEQVDIAIRVKEGYQVGFVKNQEGSYDIVADWWGVKGISQRNLTERLQEEFEKIQNKVRHEYAVQTVTEQVAQMGFNIVEQQENKDGSVRIMVRRWS